MVLCGFRFGLSSDGRWSNTPFSHSSCPRWVLGWWRSSPMAVTVAPFGVAAVPVVTVRGTAWIDCPPVSAAECGLIRLQVVVQYDTVSQSGKVYLTARPA